MTSEQHKILLVYASIAAERDKIEEELDRLQQKLTIVNQDIQREETKAICAFQDDGVYSVYAVDGDSVVVIATDEVGRRAIELTTVQRYNHGS